MNNTENNVAAQAGDEPMPSALTVSVHHNPHGATVVVNIKRGETVTQLYAQDHEADCETLGWQILPRGFEVSPRATADVERDPPVPATILRAALKNAALGQSSYGTNYDGAKLGRAIEILIATTKPGA